MPLSLQQQVSRHPPLSRSCAAGGGAHAAAAVAPALPSPRNVATSQSAVKGKDQPRKRNSKSVEFALDMSQGQQQRSKAVASMDYSMCLSPRRCLTSAWRWPGAASTTGACGQRSCSLFSLLQNGIAAIVPDLFCAAFTRTALSLSRPDWQAAHPSLVGSSSSSTRH